MTRRPGDTSPEPEGGHAAERLREFIEQRYPDEVPEPETPPAETADRPCDAESDEKRTVEAETKPRDAVE